jgi:hypothetical protein
MRIRDKSWKSYVALRTFVQLMPSFHYTKLACLVIKNKKP